MIIRSIFHAHSHTASSSSLESKNSFVGMPRHSTYYVSDSHGIRSGFPSSTPRHMIADYIEYLKRNPEEYRDAESKFKSSAFEKYEYFDQFLRMAIKHEDQGDGGKYGLRYGAYEKKFQEAYGDLKFEAYAYHASKEVEAEEQDRLDSEIGFGQSFRKSVDFSLTYNLLDPSPSPASYRTPSPIPIRRAPTRYPSPRPYHTPRPPHIHQPPRLQSSAHSRPPHTFLAPPPPRTQQSTHSRAPRTFAPSPPPRSTHSPAPQNSPPPSPPQSQQAKEWYPDWPTYLADIGNPSEIEHPDGTIELLNPEDGDWPAYLASKGLPSEVRNPDGSIKYNYPRGVRVGYGSMRDEGYRGGNVRYDTYDGFSRYEGYDQYGYVDKRDMFGGYGDYGGYGGYGGRYGSEFNEY